MQTFNTINATYWDNDYSLSESFILIYYITNPNNTTIQVSWVDITPCALSKHWDMVVLFLAAIDYQSQPINAAGHIRSCQTNNFQRYVHRHMLLNYYSNCVCWDYKAVSKQLVIVMWRKNAGGPCVSVDFGYDN